ncbi:MAG TPA: hypothetical protein VK689_20340, partial [Armatimonadota bacterium]|nr:hypothetical protein [Armatimonadota bacterium]
MPQMHRLLQEVYYVEHLLQLRGKLSARGLGEPLRKGAAAQGAYDGGHQRVGNGAVTERTGIGAAGNQVGDQIRVAAHPRPAQDRHRPAAGVHIR